jgi:hypothetical protein
MPDTTTPQPANESGRDAPAPAIGRDEAGFTTAAYQLHHLDEQIADIKATRPTELLTPYAFIDDPDQKQAWHTAHQQWLTTHPTAEHDIADATRLAHDITTHALTAGWDPQALHDLAHDMGTDTNDPAAPAALTAHTAQGLTVEASHLLAEPDTDSETVYIGTPRDHTHNTGHHEQAQHEQAHSTHQDWETALEHNTAEADPTDFDTDEAGA